ncbi:MAG: hypothetical protein KAU99_04120 [Thermoplasmata archaeon]|nr:hypothetical protein [Thermoplasmata archaeon]
MNNTEGYSTPNTSEQAQQTGQGPQQAAQPVPSPQPAQVPGPSVPKKKPIWPIGLAVVVVVVIVLLAVMMNPATSPIPGLKDSDGDGYTDDQDDFPNDPTEWKDTDGDGYGDNQDVFPTDPDEWYDSDNDGVGDNTDEFPNDPTEWKDSDGDGYGDNGDEFPHDPSEWRDSDSDGLGDNADFYDSGNGGVQVTVTYFLGDCGNWFGDCDPQFKIEVDINNDGTYDVEKTVSYYNDDELFNPITFKVDIDDDEPAIKFRIRLKDLDGGETIDYNPDPGYTGYSHTDYKPYSYDSWSHQGLGTPSCLLEYSIQAVGM